MQKQQKKASQSTERPSGRYAALIAAVGWCWALALLATREHSVLDYQVLAPAPPAWGFIILSLSLLLSILTGGALLGIGCAKVADQTDEPLPTITRCLAASYMIPVLDLARHFGVAIPATFFEPLLLAFITGQVAGCCGRRLPMQDFMESRTPRAIWRWLPWLLAIAAGAWWYCQGKSAYDNYLLGFHDFGHFARRVVNTWEGRGFLMETPSLPPFWDHFNPGLALLAPLWGIWPDAKLFILLQAVCLTVPAPLIYLIARRHGASEPASAVWSAAYLLFPALGQLNLNFSYGWHPLSLALPLLFAATAAMLHGRILASAVFTLLACSFNEAVIVIVGGVAFGMAVDRLVSLKRSKQVSTIDQSSSSSSLLAERLRCRTWVVVWVVCIVAFVLTYKFAGYAKFQSGRVLSNLGFAQDSAHWLRFVYFVLALSIPVGVASLARGWTILLALAVPLTVILSWSYLHPTSIAFQYSTAMIPVLFVAAIAGSCKSMNSNSHDGLPRRSEQRPNESTVSEGHRTDCECFTSAGLSAFGAAIVASLLFGAMPWSCPTIKIMILNSYQTADGRFFEEDSIPIAARRSVGSHGNDILNEAVKMVGGEGTSVLATSRVASHLLGVSRLEPVDEAINRWDALGIEVGSNRSPIELFDWIVLDNLEVFQQNREQMKRIQEEAVKANYKMVLNEHDIIVFTRPDER